MARLRFSVRPVIDAHLQIAALLPPTIKHLHGEPSFFTCLHGGVFANDAQFNLRLHRRDRLQPATLDEPDRLFLQVDSLSFRLVQNSPVTSTDVPKNQSATYCLSFVCAEIVVRQELK
jgi:hypothetical protein